MSVLESFAKGQTITKSASAAGRIALNVERAAGDLEDSVAELRSAVSTLEETVNPLLRAPEPEQPCADRKLGESEFADRILRQKDEVDYLAYRIRALTSRL